MTTRRQLIAAGIALFALLCGLYFLTYDGYPISNDELFVYDYIESLVNHGSFRSTYLFDLRPSAVPVRGQPWPLSVQEPMQSILAAPLLLAARELPAIGMMHSVWLFNIGVTAATAVLLYWAGMVFRFRPVVAWIGALLYGVATLAWPYSGTFFREPLAGLSLLLIVTLAYRLQVIWQGGRRSYGVFALMAAALVALALTKLAALLALPVVLALMVPPRAAIKRRFPYLVGAVALGIVALLVIFLLGERLSDNVRFQFSYWRDIVTDIQWEYVAESVIGYTVSPGRSFWLYSPVLLLGLPGAAMLWRKREWRVVVGPVIAFVTLAAAYGAGRGELWWGGNGWGPRHFIPLVPVFMLWTLPVIDRVLLARGRIGYKAAALAVIIVSVGVQMLGVLVSIYDHYDLLAAEDLRVWDEGMWTWRWGPIARHTELLDLSTPDVAWHFTPHATALTLILAIVGIVGAGIWAEWTLSGRRLPRRGLPLVTGGLALLLIASVGAGLYALRDDYRYLSGNLEARPMVNALDDVVTADDAVFLQSLSFQRQFMNYFKVPALVAGLPYAPGENYDPETDPREMREMPPGDLLGPGTTYAFDWTADRTRSIWVVVDADPSVWYELRPTERYLSQHYFYMATIAINPFARAVHYDTRDVPQGDPAVTVDATFGDVLALDGYDLLAGDSYRPGDVVPLSLVWRAVGAMETDYIFSAQIAPRDLPPVAQIDGLPLSGFGYTSRWEAGQTFRDNYGLQVPADLPPGEYVIQVIVYSLPDGERLPVGDGDLLVLQPITVQ